MATTTKNRKGKRSSKAKPRGRSRALTEQQELQVAGRYLAGETQAEIAADLGVGVNTIGRLCKRAGITKDMRVERPSDKSEREDLRQRYEALGDPPKDDPVGVLEWAHGILAVMAQRIATDREYDGTEEEREAALVKVLQTMSSTTPKAAVSRAVKIIKGDRKALGKKKGPELTSVSSRKRR